MMKISFSLVFLIFIASIILLQPQNCRVASLSRRQDTSPTNNTVSAAAVACDSDDHSCLVADVAGTDSFDSDPRLKSTLASNSDPVTTSTFNPYRNAVSCRTVDGRYTSCLGDRKTTSPGSPGCRGTYDRNCYRMSSS